LPQGRDGKQTVWESTVLHDDRLHISLPPSLSALAAVRHQVEAFLAPRVSRGDVRDIVLCLQEAMKNAVRFSGSPEDLDIAVQLVDHTVVLVVRDHGLGFATTAPPPRDLVPPDPLSPSGRGLFLIGRLMDEVELVSGRGAEVRMLKRVGPAHRAA
jgi:anti-sigma regulatory factor (Ser/Thr protein kinase)